MNALVKDWANSSGHYYDREGNPAYEVENKAKGGTRPTTVRDAKKLGYLPSITTLLKLLDKPGLTAWLIDQAILSALTLPRREDEPEAEWIARVKQDAKETGRKAAERGTAIHAAIESYFRGEPYAAEYKPHVEATVAAVYEKTGVASGWMSERSASSKEHGYGCKTDLICDGWTIDFKSKEFGPDAALQTWDEQAIQLQANSKAHNLPNNRAAIVYVSASHPGTVQFIEVERKELDRGFRMLEGILYVWRAKHDYDPRG